jgi:hypothetical protein
MKAKYKTGTLIAPTSTSEGSQPPARALASVKNAGQWVVVLQVPPVCPTAPALSEYY